MVFYNASLNIVIFSDLTYKLNRMDVKKLKEEIHKESYRSDPRSLIDVIDVDTLIEIIEELQAKNNEVLDLVSDCEIDNLLSDLDKDATDYNGYEYGLPICGEWLVTLRTTVRTWLNK